MTFTNDVCFSPDFAAHDVFIGLDEQAGPIAITQIPVADGLKTIIRTRKGDFRLILPATGNHTRRIAAIKGEVPEFRDTKIKTCKVLPRARLPPCALYLYPLPCVSQSALSLPHHPGRGHQREASRA